MNSLLLLTALCADPVGWAPTPDMRLQSGESRSFNVDAGVERLRVTIERTGSLVSNEKPEANPAKPTWKETLTGYGNECILLTADWCQHCPAAKSKLEQANVSGLVVLLDVDKDLEAKRYKYDALPTLICLTDGTVKNMAIGGAIKAEKVAEWTGGIGKSKPEGKACPKCGPDCKCKAGECGDEDCLTALSDEEAMYVMVLYMAEVAEVAADFEGTPIDATREWYRRLGNDRRAKIDELIQEIRKKQSIANSQTQIGFARVYTMDGCIPCDRLKREFKTDRIQYLNVSRSATAKADAKERGIDQVPTLLMPDGTTHTGYTDCRNALLDFIGPPVVDETAPSHRYGTGTFSDPYRNTPEPSNGTTVRSTVGVGGHSPDSPAYHRRVIKATPTTTVIRGTCSGPGCGAGYRPRSGCATCR